MAVSIVVVFVVLAFITGFAGVRCVGVVFVMWVWRSSWGSGVRHAGLVSIVWVLVMGCAGVCHAGVVWVWCLSCRFGVRHLGVAFIALVFVVGCAGICCSVIMLVRCSSHWCSLHWYLSGVVPVFVVLLSCWCGGHRAGICCPCVVAAHITVSITVK